MQNQPLRLQESQLRLQEISNASLASPGPYLDHLQQRRAQFISDGLKLAHGKIEGTSLKLGDADARASESAR